MTVDKACQEDKTSPDREQFMDEFCRTAVAHGYGWSGEVVKVLNATMDRLGVPKAESSHGADCNCPECCGFHLGWLTPSRVGAIVALVAVIGFISDKVGGWGLAVGAGAFFLGYLIE